MLSGAAWLTRDYAGNVLFHARDTLISSSNRIIAELKCIRWALRSLWDLHVKDVICVSDCLQAVEALQKPSHWPRYQMITKLIQQLHAEFECCSFEVEDRGANSIESVLYFQTQK